MSFSELNMNDEENEDEFTSMLTKFRESVLRKRKRKRATFVSRSSMPEEDHLQKKP